MRLEKRSVFSWGSSGAGYANPRNGIAVHYDGSNQSLAKKTHAYCRAYWRSTRTFHMGPSRRWADIGYSFAVCPHGIVLEGRGLNHVQAAQPGGNSTWYSVTFMSGPTEQPTAAQLQAFRELRAWLRGKGVSSALRPHSAFISTSCCGDILRKLISNGTLAASAKEDDVSAEDVWNYPIDTGDGKKPWRAKSVLGNLEKDQDATNAMLKEALERLGGIEARLTALEGKA